MKIITKKISLEPYKSRINGSLTSYDGDEIINFVNFNIKSQFNNYNMFPFDVNYNGKVLSYPTLMERYYFCKKYLELLDYSSKCGDDKYDDIIDYYNQNFKYKTSDIQKEYDDLHLKFNEYGGYDFFEWCEDILYGGNVNTLETAHILIPILFTNTIDDMGEYSILCNEWEEGVDYRSSDYFLGLNSEHSQGALVIYDDKIWKFNSSNSSDYGSLYSNKYKELYFPQIKDIEHDLNYQWYNKSITNGFEGSQNQWVEYISQSLIPKGESIMSGYTESKLSSFKTYDIAFDDMGNELPGRLQTSGSGKDMQYIQPTEGSYLELPYKVGTVCDLTVIGYDDDGNANEFFGNILTKITLYEGETILKDNLSNSESINSVINGKENIKCVIKYHMGAILTKNSDNVYSIKEGNDGITYEEEVKLVDRICDYMVDEISSFIIHYYDIEYFETFDKLNEYSNTFVKVGKSKFSHKINNSTENRVENDGVLTAPIFREEYKFGSSSLENIETDIYIDRGFSSSFEKHLKLLDIKSFEALEQYGNGFYNIIEN